MNQINIEAARQQFRQLARAYERPLRGKLALLAPLRDELLELERKGATGAEIAAMLAQLQITVTKDTVGRFLRTEAAKERSTTRARKAGPDAPASDNGGAAARPMQPRGV